MLDETIQQLQYNNFIRMDNSQLDDTDINLIERKKNNSKVPSGTVTRNFFEIEDIEDDINEASSPTKLIEPKVQQTNQSSGKQVKRKLRNLKLKPLGAANPHVIQLNSSEKKVEENPEKKQDKKQIKVKDKKIKLNFELSSSEDEQQILQINKSTNPKQQQPKKQIHNSSNVLLSQSVDIPEVEPQQAAQQDDQSEQVSPNNNGQVNMDNSRNLNIHQCVTYIMRRDKQWLNKIWPLFNLHTKSDNQYVFSAKLTGNNKETTFTICESTDQFVQNSPKYLGKVKTNFIGNIINIYGPGYNPSDYKNKNLPIRQLLATVQYETNFFGSTRPRNFKVYVLKHKISYYDDLEGPIRGQDEIPLCQLIERGDNKRKILIMQNRKPSWNESIKGYMLYFGGRVKKASIKNFILEDEDHPETARLIFGKLDQDQFRLDVGAPISPIVGFGIALSTFGGKIGCE